MPVPQGTETVDSLAQKIKAKYPQYADKDNADLVRRIVSKYPQYQKVLSTASLQKSAAASAPSVLGPLPVLGYTAGGAIQTLAGVLSPIFQNPTLAPLQMGPEISTAIAEKGPVKAAIEAVPGEKGIVSGIDLAKRYAFGGPAAEQLGLQKLGKPISKESIEEAQKNIAESTGSLAVLGALPKFKSIAKTPEQNLNIGLKQVDDALATSAGKAGRKALSMRREIKTAAPDLVEASKEIDPSLKGAEKLHDFAEKIEQRREEIWRKGHEPGILRHADATVDTESIAKAAEKRLTPMRRRVNQPEAARAQAWIDTAVRPKMTIAQLDEFIHDVNRDIRNKDPREVGGYGEMGIQARMDAVSAARAVLDKRLEELGAKGVREYNRRWGALGKVADQVQVRAVQMARQEARNNLDRMPKWAHIYSFWHGHGIPFIGIGVHAAHLLRRTPADVLFSGIDRLERSGIEPTPFPTGSMSRPIAGQLGPAPIVTEPPADTSFVRGVTAIPEAPEAVRKGRLLPQGEGIGPIPAKPSFLSPVAGSEPTPTGGARGYTILPQPKLRYGGTVEVTPAEVAVPESAKTGRMLPSGAAEVFDPKSGLPPQPGQVTTVMGKTWFFDGSDWKILK